MNVWKIIAKIVQFYRKRRQIPNEVGDLTSDIFRYRVRRKVRELLPVGNVTVLDLGAGEGFLLYPFLQAGKDIRTLLLDLKPEMIRKARNNYWPRFRGKASIIQGTGASLPLKENSVEVVAILNTFYNLPSLVEIDEIFREVRWVLKPRGFLIFDIRNRQNPWGWISHKWAHRYDPSLKSLPFNAHRINEIEPFLKKNGLKLTRIYPLTFWGRKFSGILILKAEKVG